MNIENGVLKGARWVKANASGGAMSPRFLVLHDTAGSPRKYSSVEWFCSKQCGTSAHFVVELDGTITQMVQTNKRAYHAGVSKWGGVVGLNSCSVGIEIVNPGKLDETGKAYFGKAAEPSEIVREKTPNHGSGYWLPYTPKQIEAVTAICRAVVEEYPDCNEIVTHWMISPGRKIDTNPLFPIQELRKAVFEPTPGAIEHTPEIEVPVVVVPESPVVKYTKSAAKSTTTKLGVGLVTGKVTDWFFGITEWVSGRIGEVAEVASNSTKESEAVLAPLASLSKNLQVNLGSITFWLTVTVVVVMLFRHLKDRTELQELRAKLPPTENPA